MTPQIYDAEHPRPGVPNPGSESAVAAGCTCPVVDNQHGSLVGGDGFYLNVSCPLHGLERVVSSLSAPPVRLRRGVRKDLVRQVTPHLRETETPRYAFYAAYGPSPSWTGRPQPRYGIVVTDRAILVFQPGRGIKTRSAGRVRRLPRNTRFAPVGRWLPYRRADLAGERIWLYRDFVKDAKQADAEISAKRITWQGHANGPD
jgi:hypothetical protein